MKRSLLLILLLVVLLFPKLSVAKEYRLDIPKLVGVWSGRTFEPLKVDVEGGGPFESVRGAKLVIKGQYYPEVLSSKANSEELKDKASYFNIYVTTYNKLQFKPPNYPFIRFDHLPSEFEVKKDFEFDKTRKEDWGFLEDLSSNFQLHISFTNYNNDDVNRLLPSLLVVKEAYLLIEAETKKPTVEPNPQVISEYPIVFENYHINWAWGYTLKGLFIDANGDVYKYDSGSKPWPGLQMTEFTHKDLYEKYKSTKLVGHIDKETVTKYSRLIEKIDVSKVERIPRRKDAGASVLQGYKYNKNTGKYIPVRIDVWGDIDEINHSEAAKQLTEWLREISKQMWSK